MNKKISLGNLEKYIGCTLKYRRWCDFTNKEEITIAVLNNFDRGFISFKHSENALTAWAFGINSIEELWVVKIPLRIRIRNLFEGLLKKSSFWSFKFCLFHISLLTIMATVP